MTCHNSVTFVDQHHDFFWFAAKKIKKNRINCIVNPAETPIMLPGQGIKLSPSTSLALLLSLSFYRSPSVAKQSAQND